MIGKIGTDIEEHKCGWLVVQALKVVTPEQRKILEVSKTTVTSWSKDGLIYMFQPEI